MATEVYKLIENISNFSESGSDTQVGWGLEPYFCIKVSHGSIFTVFHKNFQHIYNDENQDIPD